MNKNNVVILAGGFGTRLSKEFPGIPKPMVPICGIPILERIIAECKKYNQTNILLVLHHLPDQIISYFGDGKKFGVILEYYIETLPMGTGGALLSIQDYMSEEYFVLYADVFTTINFLKLITFHKSNNADISIVVHPNDHPFDSDLIVVDENNRVKNFNAPPHDGDEILENSVNAAFYYVNKKSLRGIKTYIEKVDIAQVLFPDLLKLGTKIYAYNTQEYIKDMGTPERQKRVEKDILNGVCEARNLESERAAIFLDRDGTINIEKGFLKNHDDLELIEHAGSAIKKINKSKYLSVCITNQPVIARGECSVQGLNKIHASLKNLLGREGAYLDGLYYCPHHPDKGFKGEVVQLKIKCDCRKPEIGLFVKAANDMNINLKKSWMIGDRTGDIVSAKSAGMLSVILDTGAGGLDNKHQIRPDIRLNNLDAATRFIVDDYEDWFNEIGDNISKITQNKFIFIDGSSRDVRLNGTSILKNQLERNETKVHIIELDKFLIDRSNLSPNNANAYNKKEIISMLKICSSELPYVYDDFGCNADGYLIDYGKSSINGSCTFLIVGLFAFDFEVFFDKLKSIKLFFKHDSKLQNNSIEKNRNNIVNSADKIIYFR
jgi:D,D-heptose 1,7-bisphosphate phosphatase